MDRLGATEQRGESHGSPGRMSRITRRQKECPAGRFSCFPCPCAASESGLDLVDGYTDMHKEVPRGPFSYMYSLLRKLTPNDRMPSAGRTGASHELLFIYVHAADIHLLDEDFLISNRVLLDAQAARLEEVRKNNCDANRRTSITSGSSPQSLSGFLSMLQISNTASRTHGSLPCMDLCCSDAGRRSDRL